MSSKVSRNLGPVRIEDETKPLFIVHLRVFRARVETLLELAAPPTEPIGWQVKMALRQRDGSYMPVASSQAVVEGVQVRALDALSIVSLQDPTAYQIQFVDPKGQPAATFEGRVDFKHRRGMGAISDPTSVDVRRVQVQFTQVGEGVSLEIHLPSPKSPAPAEVQDAIRVDITFGQPSPPTDRPPAPPARQIAGAPLTVVVRDKKGAPVPKAQVEVVGAGQLRAQVASPDGQVTFSDVPAATVRVRAEAPGYKPAEGEVTVAEGKPAVHVFTLEAEATPRITPDILPTAVWVLGGMLAVLFFLVLLLAVRSWATPRA